MSDETERRGERQDRDATDVYETRHANLSAWLASCVGTAADRRNQARFVAWSFA